MESREATRAKHAAELEAKKRKLEEIRRRKAHVKEVVVDTEAPPVVAPPFQEFLQHILEEEKQKVMEETSQAVAAATAPSLTFAEKMSKLSTVTQLGQIDIVPIQIEVYDKATGMDPMDFPDEPMAATPSIETTDLSNPNMPPPVPSPRKIKVQVEPLPAAKPVMPPKEKRDEILSSVEMEAFLTKSGNIMERALIQAGAFDVMRDYSQDDDVSMVDVDHPMTASKCKQLFVYRDAKWTRSRAVTDIDISPFYNELSLVAYNARGYLEDDMDTSPVEWNVQDAMAEAEGVVLLWSSNMPTHPEYKFTCNSQVMSACFNPFDRHVLMGGTYSGQVVLWDTRAKNTPVQKTTLSANGHTHPIYSMSVVGTKSSYNLVSASTDGRMCVWNINQLHSPVDVLDLRVSSASPTPLSALAAGTSLPAAPIRKMQVPVTTLAFQKGESTSNVFTIGTESGELLSAQLDDTSKNPHHVKAREVLVHSLSKDKPHYGPMTSMHYNPLIPHHQDVLLLTSSVDWSCRLWSQKSDYKPIISFEPANDYVYDIRWSPVHPGLFCTADGSGKVSLWNISQDSEIPVADIKVSDRALNKVRWTPDGKRLIIGDSAGDTYVYELPSDIAQPRADETQRLESKLTQAIARTADMYL
ncbi:cytoplasmic dynein intermediate chain [Thraustotheca clavata]|uniref:Cytoplasmic dynein intermediate chain n=1 Tax=Thraustotheca clavata TaxID=74557 RepID=A0A1W0AAI2_9STRA|nr:cytoplasmic dynein intermediate chain [Thraustotheca clavata]